MVFSMTRRITVSLPDEVAEALDAEPNASGYVAAAITLKRGLDATSAMHREIGYVFTEEGLAAARKRLRATQARLAARRTETQ